MSSAALKHTVAIYARVSTRKQVGGRFDSCEAQVERCKEYIARNENEGWVLKEEFVDPAFSGKNMERPRMRALKAAIAAGEIKIVVVFKLERVLRSTDEWAPFRSFLKEHGCRLVSVSEDLSEDTVAGRLKNNILVSVSEYERLNTSDKVSNKMHMQATKGFWNGGTVPYGYTYDSIAKMLSPDPIEGPIMYDMYAKAAKLVPLTIIAEDLFNRGIRTRLRSSRACDGSIRQGRRFRSDGIRQLIRNPIYRGVVRSRGSEYLGQHSPIVDQQLWDAANAAVSQTIKPAARTNRPDRDVHFNVLKGLVFCAECNRAMVPHASGKLDKQGKPYRYYTCNEVFKERSDASCRVRQVSGPAIEACVISLLGEMARRPEVLSAVLAVGKTNAHGQKDKFELKVRNLTKELTQVTQQIGNLVDAIASSGLGALRERVEQLTAKKETLLVEKERAQQDVDSLQLEHMAPAKISAALGKFDLLWSHLNAEEKRELVNLVIARVDLRAAKHASAVAADAKSRSLRLCVKLHLPGLLTSSGAIPLLRKSKMLAIDASVQIPASATGEILITAPFSHRIAAPKAEPCKGPKAVFHGANHPIHRARAVAKTLDAVPGLTPQALAVKEKVSPSTICQWRKLVRLSPQVQEALLAIADRATAWRCSLRRLLPLVGLPPAEQWAAFEKIRTGNRVKRGRMSSAGGS